MINGGLSKMENEKERRRFLKYLFSFTAISAGSVLFNKNKKMRFRDYGLTGMGPSEANAAETVVPGMKKIAVEEHFTTEKICNYIESRVKAGAKYNLGAGYKASGHAPAFIGDERLRTMDQAGIDMQVISPVCLHEGLVDPAEAAAAAKITNDETSRIIKECPKRFAGFAGLACHAPDAAAQELERAVKELGLKGAMVYSHIQGEYLDAQKFWPIFETAERLGVPIYLHPKEPSPDMIKPYMTYPALAGKIWGYAADAGLHAMRLIASGLFDRYPNLRIILAHGGEGLPALMWRMGMGDDNALPSKEGAPDFGPMSRLLCKKQPGQYVKENFYVTTSGMFWAPVLEFLHSAMGPDRVLFAVDYPGESSVLGVQSIESMSITNEDKEKIFHLNTERLLKM
jgi:5-carboxyvanillate decarboxylase